ncbi:TRAF3-interacting protein 1 isoform X2 [Dunckerocampus dactyliophorus]|uniref:TRAF3-interacting protein 1 isoform X2 n=1 Tax=Dunckerocampus dactyliophorus TaxID=161453 RepID=UPI002404E5C7|nr:TRAF3-interacting protein 1 isoform X2 [Dunckerocampus dactyliophorus]
MNAAVVKKTQDTLGKVIKKPPLTEKLLSKPPFRYLHDIFSEIIRTTGFMKGLYKDSELKSDNVKDKESKMAFLQKAIDVVALVSGEPLAAKPARIVAGHEPEKTNELLQCIAKCCLNKMSSEEAVKRVLSGEKVDLKTKASTSKSQDKENRDRREQQSSDREEKKKIEHSGSREEKDSDQPREQERQHRDGERDHRHNKERSGKNHRREQDHANDVEKDKSRERGPDKEKDKGRGKDQEQEKDSKKEKSRDRNKDKEKIRERDSQRDHEKNKEKLRERDKETERHKEEEDKSRSKDGHSGNSKDRISELQQKNLDDDARKPVPADPVPADEPAENVENQSETPARLPRPSSAKGQRRKPRIDGRDASDSEGDADAQVAQGPAPKESGDAGSSFSSETAASKRMVRPSSARPAPPRVKKLEDFSEGVPADRVSSAKSSVIRDGKKLSDEEEEEDEQFIVAQAAPEPADAPDKELGSAQDFNSEEKHGGLVKKILETKKDYESLPSSSKSKEKLVSEEARKKEQDLVTREIERLRASIQSVCQSALPLGKIMDYVQEDIDAMQAELQSWRKENKEHAQALLQEQRATDWALEPLKAELYELDQMIKDYQDKICALRSNILRNEEKIQKKLAGIISSPT